MKIFRIRSVGLACTLISYVDDGDIIVQSPEIATNCVMLRHAYGIVFDLFTRSRRSVDPSVHSGQAHSLAVCKALSEWFFRGGDRSLEFIGTPSKLEWGIHHQAHVASRSLPPIPTGRRPATSLDSVRGQVPWLRIPRNARDKGEHHRAHVCQWRLVAEVCGRGHQIMQSPEIATNCVMLRHAYGIVFDLFTGFSLALEHDKTELFHLTGFDRSLDLGYAPYTGDNPLKPKTFWRYLGFYVDRKLTFKEHVRYYTTKALTAVMAMRMLGNSTRGLSLRNKRIPYRACVVPIATYGHRLWYYEGAKVKGALKSLNSMQRKAALWITGAFRTSPTGGVGSLAGLPPISLHIQKLSLRAIY
ncbi:hypothetical protein EST38_g13070 [Candolleomyces aberdarensis]|uniref:Reverse transcriptase n=1 Tax=Candolleomyces aberdarensis TaxID=2316362 RepID=A0A4Q2D0V4_9AGAR|nr:hypothetical protein EST38_g13070 [Candolleomyces aberdarensis]